MPILNYLAVGAAVLVALFVNFFASGNPPAPKPLPEMPSLGVIPATIPLSTFFNPLAASVASTATSGKPAAATTTLDLGQTVLVPQQPKAAAAPAAPVVATAPAQPTVTTENLNTSVGLVRGAIVNIICVPKSGPLRSASATGVVIDSRGVILTVAHMAQYFLLTDYPKQGSVACVIRTGSPASTAYTASLAYISPDWIKANKKTLTEDTPTGTGENDFALLAIDASATNAPLPSSFTAISLSSETPVRKDAVTIGSYGAEFLSSATIKNGLYPIVVFGSVGDRFTFGTNTVDLLAIDRTAAAQEGSSGGAVVNSDNQLIGLITTSSSGDISGRDLHAITPRHIRSSFLEDTGESLDVYLADHSPAQMVEDFADRAAALTKTLGNAVE